MSGSSEATRQCLTFEDRATTPPHIRKFRRSTYLEPGRRFQHYGIVDDISNLHLDNKIFGVTESLTRDGASDLIRPAPLSDLQRLNIMKQERIYKNMNREPLGHSPDRKINLPKKFTEGKES